MYIRCLQGTNIEDTLGEIKIKRNGMNTGREWNLLYRVKLKKNQRKKYFKCNRKKLKKKIISDINLTH